MKKKYCVCTKKRAFSGATGEHRWKYQKCWRKLHQCFQLTSKAQNFHRPSVKKTSTIVFSLMFLKHLKPYFLWYFFGQIILSLTFINILHEISMKIFSTEHLAGTKKYIQRKIYLHKKNLLSYWCQIWTVCLRYAKYPNPQFSS